MNGLLAIVIALPFFGGALVLRMGRHTDLSQRASMALALGLVVLVTLTPAEATMPLVAGRNLILTAIGQLSIQLLALATLGLILSLSGLPAERAATWLPVTWFSLGGLTVALCLDSLPLALLAFVGAGLLWAFGLPEADRVPAGRPVLRYAALLSLSLPLLMSAFRLAELRSPGGVAVETAVMAAMLPGFGLVLGIVPVHAWTLTLASGAPRTMVLGVLALVQTAGFALLLKTIGLYPWITAGVYGDIITYGGAMTAMIGGWLALSADRADPDDWLAYASVANAGMLIAGLGTQSQAAGTGVVLLLLARVLALVLLALATEADRSSRRLGEAAATLTLAGTPLMAGFPGLWLILDGVREVGGLAHLGLVAGSGLLLASGVRRGLPRSLAGAEEALDRLALENEPALEEERGLEPHRGPTAETPRTPMSQPGPASAGQPTQALGLAGRRRAILLLVALLFALGIAPQLVASAFADPLRDLFFPR